MTCVIDVGVLFLQAEGGIRDYDVTGVQTCALPILSIWDQKHTGLVIRREDDFEALIDINRIIMQGLSPSAAEAA